MKMKRNIIEIDEKQCNGCGRCVSKCTEGAIELVEGKAKLISENYCDGLAACLGECPEGALKIVERASEAFDPEAVEHHLHKIIPAINEVLPCGCSSTHVQIFSSPNEAANHSTSLMGATSMLAHWPLQIKLIPPTAPFLKNADMLVAADCTPVAYPAFHHDFLRKKAVLIGCPKFDDTEEYINKFAEIFKVAEIKSITILIMEVPCCSKLPAIVHQGMTLAAKQIPVEIITISAKGKILKREWLQ